MSTIGKGLTPDEAWRVFERAECLYDMDAVERSLDAMAVDIARDLARQNPLVICILNGALVVLGKLLPRLQFPLQLDYVHATRYGDKLRGDMLQWIAGAHQPFAGRTVLLVDDILDEGTTLAEIERHYLEHGAERVYKAVLVVKDRPRTEQVHVDYLGMSVPDRYIFGYGMDYKGYLRNAPGIYAEAKN